MHTLDELSAELEARKIQFTLKRKGDVIPYLISEKGDKAHIVCETDTLVVQINQPEIPYVFISRNLKGIYEVLLPEIRFLCKSYDVTDIINVITLEKTFIHMVDQNSAFTKYFTDAGVLVTHSFIRSLNNLQHVNIYTCTLEELSQEIHKMDLGFMSPRGINFGITAASLRSVDNNRVFNEAEERVLKVSDLEISFERIRRERYSWAPSRLSGIYLMDNSDDSRFNLGNMFRGRLANPEVIILQMAGIVKFIKADYTWVDAYAEEANPVYIDNYWSGLPNGVNSSSWEYVYEGALLMGEINS